MGDAGHNTVRALMVPLALLLAVLVAPGLALFGHAPAVWVFLTGVVGIEALADWIRRATEQVVAHVGPAIGGCSASASGAWRS